MEPKSIPQSAAPFFQEYDFNTLDAIRDQELILERILSHGNRVELNWLFRQYGKQEIRAWVQKNGSRRLPLKQYNFWCVFLDLKCALPAPQKVWKY